MKTIFDRTAREELITRIEQINENKQAQWGKMNVYQMLRHNTYWNEWILGKNTYIYKQTFMGKLFGKIALKRMIRDKQFLIFIFLLFFAAGAKAQKEQDETAFFPKVETTPNTIPDKENVWVFILAGQSNMAGRGKVEPSDTIPDPRILSINKDGELILAKEPLHFYEPRMAGLDCGLSFAKALLPSVPDSVSLLVIPTAVGGSAISQWINDETFRDVPLLSNFKEKVAIGKEYGTIKGILWHQGENDALKPETIAVHQRQLQKLFKIFRKEVGDKKLPVFLGELGSFSTNDENWQKINAQIQKFVANDRRAYLIKTADLNHNGDRIHFDSEGLRRMGERFARAYIKQMR